jgi:hypothetical protein
LSEFADARASRRPQVDEGFCTDELPEFARLQDARATELCRLRRLEHTRHASHVVVVPVGNDHGPNRGSDIDPEPFEVIECNGIAGCPIDARVDNHPLAGTYVHDYALANTRAEQRNLKLGYGRRRVLRHRCQAIYRERPLAAQRVRRHAETKRASDATESPRPVCACLWSATTGPRPAVGRPWDLGAGRTARVPGRAPTACGTPYAWFEVRGSTSSFQRRGLAISQVLGIYEA